MAVVEPEIRAQSGIKNWKSGTNLHRRQSWWWSLLASIIDRCSTVGD